MHPSPPYVWHTRGLRRRFGVFPQLIDATTKRLPLISLHTAAPMLLTQLVLLLHQPLLSLSFLAQILRLGLLVLDTSDKTPR